MVSFMGMDRRSPLVRILALILGLILAGSTGYYLLFQGAYPFRDCLYMTVISISTVGYGEVLPVRSTPGLQMFTVGLIVFGMGILGYSVTTLSAYILEGRLGGDLRRNRMEKRIAAMKGHVIVCGAGDTGHYVLEELVRCGVPVVVVDSDAQRLEACRRMGDIPDLAGDAADDAMLRKAGVERAAGLVAALSSDRDNLFLVMSAQMLNPNLRIVAKAHDGALEAKMRRAGASAVVSPNFIGGMRIASEVIRPRAVEFFDAMLRHGEGTYRVSDVAVEAGGALDGRTLRELNLPAGHGIQVLALREGNAAKFQFNPPPDTRLSAGQVMVVLGEMAQIAKLR